MVGAERDIKEVYVKTGQVRLAFNPILDHDNRSVQTSLAAECAAEQGQFWLMHDLLFERQNDLWGGDIQQKVKDLAAELPSLDHQQFNVCIVEQRYVDVVSAQDAHRRELGIRTRPTLDINGQIVIGAQKFNVLQGVIEPMLGQ